MKLKQENDGAQVSPRRCCKAESWGSTGKLQAQHLRGLLFPEPATAAAAAQPKHRFHVSTIPSKGRSFSFSPPQRDSQSFLPININPGRRWVAHNQSSLRLMIILDAPCKRETPS